MKKIHDQSVIDGYVDSTGITELFACDVRRLLDLFHFKKDEFLLYEGDHSDHIYFLADGELKIYSSIGNGKSLAHGYFPFFRVLGESACLWGDAAMATVQCETDSYCFGISLARHRDTLLEDVTFLRYICGILRTQMSALRDASRTHFYPLESRLASFLLHYSEDGVLRHNLLTCSELLSVSYRHLLRVVGAFCEQGYVEKIGKSRYRITDREALAALASQTFKGTGRLSHK